MAIEPLPEKDYLTIKNWIFEKDWEIWEKKIKEYSEKGGLDFLITEAFHENTIK